MLKIRLSDFRERKVLVMYYNLENKTIMITGAAGGIGSACARALYMAGAELILTDISQKSLDLFAKEFDSKRVLALSLDVTDFKAAQRIVNKAVDKFGKLDVIFANAGISWHPSAHTMLSCDEKEFERIVEVDLLGVWRSIKAALPEIVRNKGQVLVSASIYSYVNGACNAPYAISKAGIEMLARSLRIELAGKCASASVLYPGWVDTGIAEIAFGGDQLASSMIKMAFPAFLRHMIKPETVAAGVVKGLQKRKSRIMIPARWIPVALMRGIFNILTDWYLGRNRKLYNLIGLLEQRRMK